MSSTEKTQEDLRFEQILSAEGYDIKAFYAQPTQNLFENATSYPAFFNQNLVSPNRVLKQFLNNPHANIKIFYYQILRVSYEIETVNDSNKIFLRNLIRIVFNPEFEILFTPQTENQRQIFNDFQFKKLFAQFIQLLQNEESPNIEQIINCFTIMDAVFIHLFRSILAFQGLNIPFDEKIPTQALFATLSHLLGLSIISYGKCWRFEDSDMFCYQQNEEQIYLAYILEGVEQQQNSDQNTQAQSNNIPVVNNNFEFNAPISSNSVETRQEKKIQLNQQNIKKSPDAQKQKNLARESMISETYQFVDFTNTTTVYKQKKPKPKNAQNQQQVVYLDKGQQIINTNSVPVFESREQTHVQIPQIQQKSVNEPVQSNFQVPVLNNYNNYQYESNNYSNNYVYQAPKIQIPSYTSNLTNYNSTTNYEQKPVYLSPYETTGYNTFKIQEPAVEKIQIKSQFNQIESNRNNNITASKFTKENDGIFNISQYKMPSSTNLSSNNSQYGDYYNDFTNSFTLEKISEPYKSNIKNMKNRIKGLRRGNVAPQNFTVSSTPYEYRNNQNISGKYTGTNQFLSINQNNSRYNQSQPVYIPSIQPMLPIINVSHKTSKTEYQPIPSADTMINGIPYIIPSTSYPTFQMPNANYF